MIHDTVNDEDNTPGLIVLAVDDEEHGLSEMVHFLENNPKVRRVLPAVDASEALRMAGATDPELIARKRAGLSAVDAVFADINMPGLSGVELARVFAAFKPAPSLVFVTGTTDNAVTAFELGAADYLLKPLNEDKVVRAVDRVCAEQAQRTAGTDGQAVTPQDAGDDEVIPVELAGTTKLISRSSVRWVEAQGDYARLHTTDGSHLVRIPLAQLEERWADAGFVRIHRSYLVALPLITELRMGASGYTVIIGEDDQQLPVSRRHTRDLKDRLVRSPRAGWGSVS
ncbi:MAG: LytR/AlgR family response regulator transcription factor [Sciscionella sp.]